MLFFGKRKEEEGKNNAIQSDVLGRNVPFMSVKDAVLIRIISMIHKSFSDDIVMDKFTTTMHHWTLPGTANEIKISLEYLALVDTFLITRLFQEKEIHDFVIERYEKAFEVYKIPKQKVLENLKQYECVEMNEQNTDVTYISFFLINELKCIDDCAESCLKDYSKFYYIHRKKHFASIKETWEVLTDITNPSGLKQEQAIQDQ